MKKTGIIPLVFLLGFFCLSMNSLADAAEKESTIEVSGLIYSEKPTEPGTDPSTDPETGSSAGPDAGSTADSATDSGKVPVEIRQEHPVLATLRAICLKRML
ncbi:hypothetical protein ACOU9P_000516 [Enterococcus faecium]|uniref:hypothetical protein n=1 Tax=Enterococcus TaxID=1350 RepID=UPI000B63DEDA|nr:MULTISPECIES: hypothetical protein [Enterococcus]OTO88272.1 hypothetical protein A5849_000167 [Enterococcus sp. 10F3_DIV0382]